MIPEPYEDLKSIFAVRQITDEAVAHSTLIESHPVLVSIVDRFDYVALQPEIVS